MKWFKSLKPKLSFNIKKLFYYKIKEVTGNPKNILKKSELEQLCSLYGIRILFDEIPEKFLDSYVGNFDESGELQPITDEGHKYIKKIEETNPTSVVEQLRNLYKFGEDLSKFKKSNFNSPFPIGTSGSGNYGMSRFLYNGIHENPGYKKKIISFLEKIDLPFEISSKSDESGNIRLSFENKKISRIDNEIKEIPLEQSGNALKSILLLLKYA